MTQKNSWSCSDFVKRDGLVKEVVKKERFIWKKVKEGTRRRENGRVD